MKQNTHEWMPLSEHGDWTVEYCLEERSVRVRLGEARLNLDREAYLMLWATITEGLDAMESADDQAAQPSGLALEAGSLFRLPQTRH